MNVSLIRRTVVVEYLKVDNPTDRRVEPHKRGGVLASQKRRDLFATFLMRTKQIEWDHDLCLWD